LSGLVADLGGLLKCIELRLNRRLVLGKRLLSDKLPDIIPLALTLAPSPFFSVIVLSAFISAAKNV